MNIIMVDFLPSPCVLYVLSGCLDRQSVTILRCKHRPRFALGGFLEIGVFFGSLWIGTEYYREVIQI